MASTLAPDNTRIRVVKHLNTQNAAFVSRVQSSSASDGGNSFTNDDARDPDPIAELQLGEMQLYSYYAPGLAGGLYNINVVQVVSRDDPRKPKPITPPPVAPAAGQSSPSTPGGSGQPAVSPSGQTPSPVPVKEPDNIPDKKKTLVSNQKFNVNAPRFTLPPNIVHQTYPPQGLGDHNNVLPHIVFEDPHLPWEQEVSTLDHAEEATEATTAHELDKTGKPRGRNMVPWLALWTFSEDELKLDPSKLKPRSEGGFFPEGKPLVPSKSLPAPTGNDREQDRSTFVVKLTMGEYLGLGHEETVDTNGKPVSVYVPVKDDTDGDQEKINPDQQVDVIIMPKDLFKNMVCTYSDQGVRDLTKGPDLHRYKYLAHVRNVNTKNMAGAGVDDDGLFSVIHAHRTGPLDLREPKPAIVHLVTLEGIEKHVNFKDLEAKTHVAMVSLHSWTYLCLPPDSINIVDVLRHIGHSVSPTGECWLRTPDAVIAAVNPPQQKKSTASASPSFQELLAKRMTDGFALQRSLLQTGEKSVSFYRGPLTPTFVPPITASWWPYQSNFSTDYQIVDRSLGIVDITYSAAWQLGRTLGIADQAFSSALVRLRTALQTSGRRGALKERAAEIANGSKATVLSGVENAVKMLAVLGSASPGANPVDPLNRFLKIAAAIPIVVPSGSSDHQDSGPDAINQAHLRANIMRVASVGTSGTSNSQSGSSTQNATSDDDQVFIPFNDIIPYNEINIPISPDWQIVQDWILRKLSLENIPAHYLIPDPSFLPREAMKFFYIDPNWMDAFIDGALSIGNHLDRTDDVVRQAFKHALNRYFSATYRPDHPEMNYYPQIPGFGFLLRSSVVKAFPNLEVHAPWPDVDDPALHDGKNGAVREPVLRLDNIDKDVMLCLFDRIPGSKHWEKDVQITISQPPHQQCFRLGGEGGVTTSKVEMQFRQLFTCPIDQQPTKDFNDPTKDFDHHKPVANVIWTQGATSPDIPPLQTTDPEGNPVPPTAQDTAEHQAEEDLLTKAKLPSAIFDWDSRIIAFPAFAAACNSVLNTFTPEGPNGLKYFDDTIPTSAVTGTMLNSYISQMKISLPEPVTAPDSVLAAALPDPITKPRKIRIQNDILDDPSLWAKVDPNSNSSNTKTQPSGSDAPPDPKTSHMSLPYYPPFRNTSPAYINKNESPLVPDPEKTRIDPKNPAIALPRNCGPQFVPQVFQVGTTPPGPGAIATIGMYKSPKDPRNKAIDLIITLTPPPVGLKGLPSQDTLHNLQLYTVEIDIPLGTTPKDLAETYTGPGGKMLSNPRFNVHTTLLTIPPAFKGDVAQNIVRFTLVPRSTGKLVPLRNIPEMNLAIWQIRPNGVEITGIANRGGVVVTITEHYRRFDWNSRVNPKGNDPMDGYFSNIGISKVFLGKKFVG